MIRIIQIETSIRIICIIRMHSYIGIAIICMTIIEPNKHKFRINLALLGMALVVAGGALASIFFYSDTVNLRHAIQEATKAVEALRAKNAEERSELYAALDADRLSATALELGFVKETSPRYLPVPSPDLAAQL